LKIYTKSGDDGETSLFGGTRVRKNDVRVAAYGDIDELSASLGAVHARIPSWPDLRDEIEGIQRLLFGIGAEIATPAEEMKARLKDGVREEDVRGLERSIDAREEELPALKAFILPGGGPAGSALHVARTVCRRAERSVVALEAVAPVRREILLYLNRLSDWLFVVARYVNHRERHTEVPW
jgi:cob(I)alamin adenosyltransferase